MLNKLTAFMDRYQMLQPGDHVVCAVSGGADSIALLFALCLLREKLHITLSAAHFNHNLRQEESDRDEQFVRDFCKHWEIPLQVGTGHVVPGKKGLEAAARDARYTFLKSLPGKIATAHTANDNAETLLMHLVRGTGLKGLGGIAPVNGQLIRPMLGVTRQDVLAFLNAYHLDYVTDSSNDTDAFLRNRLRHHVVPILEQENPRFVENSSALALRLREDECVLSQMTEHSQLPGVEKLRQMPKALRSRCLTTFLHNCGVSDPEAEHISLVEKLVYSEKPSARADFPNGVVILRIYEKLEKAGEYQKIQTNVLSCPGSVTLPDLGLRVVCEPADRCCDTLACFTVQPKGQMVLRARQPGDTMRLRGGTKDLKKLFIDRKIPAHRRANIPVIADDLGVLGVYGFGANRLRVTGELPAVTIRFDPIDND